MTPNELRYELHNPQQAHPLVGQAWIWAKSQLTAGRAVVAEFRLLEEEKTEAQRRYYHGVVLTQIAEQARANGQRFPMPVWKEFFRDKFLGHRRILCVNPITGRKSRRSVRRSTEDLSVKGYAELIEKVTAFAVTELGVEFSEEYRG